MYIILLQNYFLNHYLIFNFISQTNDIGSSKSLNISMFCDKVLYGTCLELIKKVTNIELTVKVDITSSKYRFTDHLLCHDDDIQDINKNGRRIAFIYYLVDKDWNKSYGGSLDLFKTDGKLVTS
jgi:Rps23 Pro-64 3,4-dihydroxylase Tpa1-like proline 4-hydroxylase